MTHLVRNRERNTCAICKYSFDEPSTRDRNSLTRYYDNFLDLRKLLTELTELILTEVNTWRNWTEVWINFLMKKSDDRKDWMSRKKNMKILDENWFYDYCTLKRYFWDELVVVGFRENSSYLSHFKYHDSVGELVELREIAIWGEIRNWLVIFSLCGPIFTPVNVHRQNLTHEEDSDLPEISSQLTKESGKIRISNFFCCAK